MLIPPCDCPESVVAGIRAMGDYEFTKGMPRTEENILVRCSHCRKILKYPRTVECTEPQTGLRAFRTCL